MFLVTNTVHLVVYSRKNELEIAKLVGASDRFVLVPFLFEGFYRALPVVVLRCFYCIGYTSWSHYGLKPFWI